MRAVHAGPLIGLIVQVLVLAALAGTVGLRAGGWVVGLTCGVIVNAALAHSLSRYRCDRLGAANWVTLARASLAVGVAALVADSFAHRAPVTLLVSITALALALDLVDGRVARRTRTTATLGAQFDGEVDAFLILILSVYVARSAGVWVLAIGAARYAFLAAGWLLPWMREPLPPRYWRKVVAATQGIVLTVAAAGILSPAVSDGRACGGPRPPCRVVRSRRVGGCGATATAPVRESAPTTPRATGSTLRPAADACDTTIGVAATIGAVVVVWAALVAPDQPGHLTLIAFLRIPLELPVLVALAVFLPARPRKILAVSAGLVLSLLIVLKAANYETFANFDRPFDPLGDTGQLGTGIETLRAAVGGTTATLIEVVAVVSVVVVVVLLTAAMLRLTRVAAGNRRLSLGAVTRARRRLAARSGVRRAGSRGPRRLHELRQPRRHRDPRGGGRHPRLRRLREADQPRPVPQHPWRPAADGSTR